MPRVVKRFPSVFAQNRAYDFERFSPDFKTHLKALVVHVQRYGGLPASTTRHGGVNLGRWVAAVQANPHVLSEAQRAVLLAVPPMFLSAEPRPMSSVETVPPDPDKSVLWERLQRWADDPLRDPVVARRVAAAKQAQGARNVG